MIADLFLDKPPFAWKRIIYVLRWQPCRRVSTRCGAIFDYETKWDRLVEVNAELERGEIWSKPELAQNLGRERAKLEDVIRPIDQAATGLKDALDLLDLAEAENDQATVDERSEEQTSELQSLM